MEGNFSSEPEPEVDYSVINIASDALDGSTIFHTVNDVVSFLLYMHLQIPSTVQDMSAEFDTLHSEYKELELAIGTTAKTSFRRQQVSKMRDIKMGIRRMDKFMNTLLKVQTAIKVMISQVPTMEKLVLALGASPLRPLHIYVLNFSHGAARTTDSDDFGRNKLAEGLSRKAIRALISKGAGSVNYPGPLKLFLLFKAPSSFNQPLHFLPKRDFRYHKQVVPLKLLVKCRNQVEEVAVPSEDMIWFQCRHVIKGLAMNTMPDE
ncbi:hypothetical protein HN51_004817 [Arachis hypogaea]|uniref:Uncharacterized protein n=2 Tax=Arachis TaxID=3817 RepID=A0A445DGY9_ARAHY|nr:uncharacterized protein LOC107484372 [Arachis duranensis]XP_025695098.1 uncharacterized protein LOC112796731 [Arachis hypogaea]QHO38467.1 uncharacterized protein DS421_4g120630 [Arachis hypogaea]RYR62453.1 hypothetical protein Ahy_A04g020064 [Arachis hypogaea]